MRSLFAALLVLSLAGCDRAHTYAIDANASPEGVAIIREAMRKWNDALLPEARLRETTNGASWRIAFYPHSIMGKVGDDGLTCEKGDPPCPDDQTIMLDEEILDYADPGVAREVVMHELGHSFGLEHESEPGVMNPSPGQLSDALSPADIAQCRDEGDCP